MYLPKQRILVAGDLVVHPVPYLSGAYPSEFVQTLRALDRMDFDALVPGHGEVLRGPSTRRPGSDNARERSVVLTWPPFQSGTQVQLAVAE